MDKKQLKDCRARLETFLRDLLEPVGRKERRNWGSVYVRGLLLDGQRKSIEPMANRLPDGNVQAMQQFIGQSPWDPMPTRRRLAERMSRELVPAHGWIVDDTGFPKKGDHSIGVARQYCGRLGKNENCQSGVFIGYSSPKGYVLLDRRIFLPEKWFCDEYKERWKKCKIPDDVKFKKKPQLAVEMVRKFKTQNFFPLNGSLATQFLAIAPIL